MDIQTSPIPKRLSDTQEVNRFLNLCEQFEKENQKEIIKEYASEALSRFNSKGNSGDDRPNLVASQGSRPLTISIRLSGTKERIPISNNPPPANTHKVPTYRQLSSNFLRVNTRTLNSYIVKLKTKRRSVLEDLSKLRDESMSTFPITLDPARQKCQYDYMLEESVLVANDFIEERKWKIYVAYILAHEAQAFYYKHIFNKTHSEYSVSSFGESSSTASEDADELQKKKIGHFLSTMVNEFWNNVKDAQNEVFHSEKKQTKEVKQNETGIQCVLNNDDSSDQNILSLYASKPSSLELYLNYCHLHHLTSVVSCSPTNSLWEDVMVSVCKQLRFTIRGRNVILVPEEWEKSTEMIMKVLYPSNHSSVQIITSLDQNKTLITSPHTLIVFASLLENSVNTLPYDLTHTHIIVVNDTLLHAFPHTLTPQLFHSTFDLPNNIISVAQLVVPLSQHSSRQTHQKDAGEGGEVHLPIELHTVPLASWQIHLRDNLIDAIEEKLSEDPSPTDTLHSMYLLHRQLELGVEDWSPIHSCSLPPIQINWPIWLWNTLIPSPYQSILTSCYDIRGYSTLSLRKKEIILLLSDRSSSLVFNYGCDMYKPELSFKEDLIQSDCMFDGLLMPPYKTHSLYITEPSVVTEMPVLTGSTSHYKWIYRSLESFNTQVCKALTPYLPEPSSSTLTTLTSPRIRNLLKLLSEGRKQNQKQLVICDSESMAYSIARHCDKLGFRVTEIVGDPTKSNSSQFWDGSSIMKFNHSPVTTIGLICLRRFAQASVESISPLSQFPLVTTIFVVEKPKPNYWQQVYQNILFMLSCRKNSNARVIEVMSELETRISFTVTEDEESREKLTTSSLRTLFGLSMTKERKEIRPALFEIFKENEWIAFEKYHDNRDFLWRENEEFPSVKREKKLVYDLENEDEQIVKNEKLLGIQNILVDLPILSYCFSVATKCGVETSSLSSVPDESINIEELLNPLTITKHFEFPTYPVPAVNSENVRPFPQTVHWQEVSELDCPKAVSSTPQLFQLQGEMAMNPQLLDSTPMNTEMALTEYTPVERSLLAWESAVIDCHNRDPTTEMDSFLYSTSNAMKNRFTSVPEQYSLSPSFCLSFSVNKSSDLSDSKAKRNRKRQRDGFEQEDKKSSDTVASFIHQHINRPYVWNQYEDEMLCTLIMQFGTGWAFISSVFLMEQLNHVARARKDCKNRWEFLSKNKAIVDARIPQAVRYLCIPDSNLSKKPNEFFYYTNQKVTPQKVHSTEKASSVPSPFSSIFSAVKQKKVHSSLHHPISVNNSVQTKLNERDLLFANEETDQAKRLQFYLRPDMPVSSVKDFLRRSTTYRPSVQGSSMNTEVKPQSNRVNVTPIKIACPPNYLELRKKSISSLPLARISICDENLFSFLLKPNRIPQDGIVIPFDQSFKQANRLQEDKSVLLSDSNSTESSQRSEMENSASMIPHMNTGINFDTITVFSDFKKEEEQVKECEVNESIPVAVKEEVCLPTRRHYPFMTQIVELESVSEKRERDNEYEYEEEEGIDSVVNLKLQKLPLSSLKRRKRMEPSTVPVAFYTPASQLARNNVSLLQHNLKEKKKQLRDPSSLVALLTNAGGPRKDMSQQTPRQGREGPDGISYDISRRPTNVSMYRTPQNGMQYSGMQQPKGNIRAGTMNQTQQPPRVAYV